MYAHEREVLALQNAFMIAEIPQARIISETTAILHEYMKDNLVQI